VTSTRDLIFWTRVLIFVLASLEHPFLQGRAIALNVLVHTLNLLSESWWKSAKSWEVASLQMTADTPTILTQHRENDSYADVC
jgi:hypothetical protein